jgi:hypothetical protein
MRKSNASGRIVARNEFKFLQLNTLFLTSNLIFHKFVYFEYLFVSRIPPPVVWAQRNDVLFVTINVETKDPEIK